MDVQGKGVIALDADGVILDYASAYRSAWEQAYGVRPALKNPGAYWPWDRWDVPRLSHAELQPLREAMDETFWSNIPALDDAGLACERLTNAGYRLVCVTAMQPRWAEARRANLEKLGFGISDVVVVDNTQGEANPKARVINALKPVAFVDDYLPYLMGIDDSVHKALIMRHADGSPNVGPDLERVNSMHLNLLVFADRWPSRAAGRARPG